MPSCAAKARVDGSVTPVRRAPERIALSSPWRNCEPRLSAAERSIAIGSSAAELVNDYAYELVIFADPVTH